MKELSSFSLRAQLSLSDANMQVEAVCLSAETSKQNIIVDSYRRLQDAFVQVQHADGRIFDEKPMLCSYLHSFTVNLPLKRILTAPAVQNGRSSDTHRSRNGNRKWRNSKLKFQSSVAEIGVSYFLYLYLDYNDLFSINKYSQYKQSNEAAGGFSRVNRIVVRLFELN